MASRGLDVPEFPLTDPLDIALIVASILLVLTGALLLRGRLRRRRKDRPAHLVLRGEFLPPPDRALFQGLEQALGREFRIFPRLPASTFLTPSEGLPKARQEELTARLASHPVDCLLCRAPEMTVCGAVLLEEDSREEDEEILQALMALSIPVLLLHRKGDYTVTELRERLKHVRDLGKEEEQGWSLGISEDAEQDENEENWLAGILPKGEERKPPQRASTGENGETLRCPACSSAMVRRRAVRGPKAGEEFWVCRNYPKCRKTLPVLPPRPH